MDDRRTEIVPDETEGTFYDVAGTFDQGTPTHPDLHHVYLDVTTGTWGDRSALVVITLTDSQLEKLAEQTPAERIAAWEGCNRYFGETYGSGIRRHLAQRDSQ